MLGKRRGFGKEPMPPHSLPLCLIGAGLLWTGWFGFNAGSALSASPLAALAFLNTSTAASTAVVAWAVIEWLHRGKPTALGGATAAVAGLVAITPACGNVSPLGAIAVGVGVSIVSLRAPCTFLKPAARLRRLARRLRRPRARRRLGRAGLGHLRRHARLRASRATPQQIMVQLKGIAFIGGLRAGGDRRSSSALLKLVFGSLRVDEEDEAEGLDLSQHSESGLHHDGWRRQLHDAGHGHGLSLRCGQLRSRPRVITDAMNGRRRGFRPHGGGLASYRRVA